MSIYNIKITKDKLLKGFDFVKTKTKNLKQKNVINLIKNSDFIEIHLYFWGGDSNWSFSVNTDRKQYTFMWIDGFLNLTSVLNRIF